MTRSVFGDDAYFSDGKVFLFYLRADKEYRGLIFQKWTMTFGDTLPDTILKSKSKEEQKYEACAANWQLMEEQQIVVQWANYPPYTNLHPFLFLPPQPPNTPLPYSTI